MKTVDGDLIELTKELANLGGSNKVKLSHMELYVRGRFRDNNDNDASILNIDDDNKSNKINIKNPFCGTDVRTFKVTQYFEPTITDKYISNNMVDRVSDSLFNGFNKNIIFYGESGIGKSRFLFEYNLSNNIQKYDEIYGLFSDLMENIFEKIHLHEKKDEFKLTISVFEANSDGVKDLLGNKRIKINGNKSKWNNDLMKINVECYKHVCFIMDVVRHNSSMWKNIDGGYMLQSNESSLFIQLKLYNSKTKQVTTVNIVDLIGIKSSLQNITDKMKKNNVSMFELNKLLHYLCNIHTLKDKSNDNNKETLITHIIHESILNFCLGPMIAINHETLFFSAVSCNAKDYQQTLRIIELLSRTLNIKVPCMHTFNEITYTGFNSFMQKWNKLLYKHMLTKHETVSLNNIGIIPTEEFTTNITTDNNIKTEINKLLHDIKNSDNKSNEHDIDTILDDNDEDKAKINLDFTNLRLEIVKLKEMNRKLKSESLYNEIFSDYDNEISMLHKHIKYLSQQNLQLTMKNMTIKQNFERAKLSMSSLFIHNDNSKKNSNKMEELKTVRILQKRLRENEKKLEEMNIENNEIKGKLRHTQIAHKLLSEASEHANMLAEELSKCKHEMNMSILKQASIQAELDKSKMETNDLRIEKEIIKDQFTSMENELIMLRKYCAKLNQQNIIKKHQQRMEQKWGNIDT